MVNDFQFPQLQFVCLSQETFEQVAKFIYLLHNTAFVNFSAFLGNPKTMHSAPG